MKSHHSRLWNRLFKPAIVLASLFLISSPAWCQNIVFFMTKGQWSYNDEDYKGAVYYYTQALRIDPYNKQALVQRGNAYTKLDDDKAALADFETLINLDPTNASVWSCIGHNKLFLNDYKGSIAAETRSIELDPSDALAYANRALAEHFSNDDNAAFPDFNQAIELGSRTHSMYFYRCILRCDRSDFQGALSDFNECIKLNPSKAHDQQLLDVQRRCNIALSAGSQSLNNNPLRTQSQTATTNFIPRGQQNDGRHDLLPALKDTHSAQQNAATHNSPAKLHSFPASNDEWIKRGDQFFNEGRYGRALQSYKSAGTHLQSQVKPRIDACLEKLNSQ